MSHICHAKSKEDVSLIGEGSNPATPLACNVQTRCKFFGGGSRVDSMNSS